MHIRRLSFLGIAVALIASGLASCHREGSKIDIAVMTKLEAGSIVGSSEINAAKSFLEERRISDVNIVPFNDDWNPDTAKKVYDQLRARGIRILITSHVSSCAVAIADQVNRDKVLTMVSGATTDALSGKVDYILRNIPDVRIEQKAVSERMNTLGAQRLVIIRDISNAAYTEPALRHFREASTIPAIRELAVEAEALDMPKIEEWLRQESFDSAYLLIGGYKSSAVGALAQLIVKVTPSAKIMLTPWVKSPVLVEAAGPALMNCILPSHYPPHGQSSAVDTYIVNFKNRYGYPPTFISLNVYTALAILCDAIEAGNHSPHDIREYILQKGTFETPLGQVRLDRFGDAQADFCFITDIVNEF